LAGAAAGEIDLLVGTHALIQEDVQLPRLALTVVDEQHRFGVRQRGRSAVAATDEGDQAVHVLVMSATPIPRSLALTLYGDLELSVIDEMPAGRLPVTTRIVRSGEEQEVWDAVRRAAAAGRQTYVVHPVIDETEGQDLKAATAEFERLRGEVLAGVPMALLHGRLPAKEKDAVMNAFSAGECLVLVATTVVEVGLDVPAATEMIIHDPDRFGLAQLHQLRGRVGRGAEAATCWLVCDRHLGEEAWERLRFFAEHRDGFELAEEDLRRRGPGDAWGVRQHGAPGFRLANPLRDQELVAVCRQAAQDLLADDPGLTGGDGRRVRAALADRWGRALPVQAG
jgi:ATP-dependent DNA helicase RecG